METVKRVADLDPHDLAVVERLLGQSLRTTDVVVVAVKAAEAPVAALLGDELPPWLNALDGLSTEDIAEFRQLLAEPVRLAR